MFSQVNQGLEIKAVFMPVSMADSNRLFGLPFVSGLARQMEEDGVFIFIALFEICAF